MEEEKQEQPQEEVKELSPLEESKKVLAEMKEIKESMDKANIEAANDLLSGTTGGSVERPQVSEEQIKTNKAKEFWKGTGLGDAINKANG